MRNSLIVASVAVTAILVGFSRGAEPNVRFLESRRTLGKSDRATRNELFGGALWRVACSGR